MRVKYLNIFKIISFYSSVVLASTSSLVMSTLCQFQLDGDTVYITNYLPLVKVKGMFLGTSDLYSISNST